MGKRIKIDAFWNTLGSGSFAAISFVILIIVTRQYGVSVASTIGIAVTTSQILFRVGLFSVRQYQVTDLEEQFCFSDYGGAKIISTGVCFVSFLLFILFSSIDDENFIAYIIIFLFYQLLSIDDLYQNRFFQKGRLDFSGKSKFIVITGFLTIFTGLSMLRVRINTSLLFAFFFSVGLSVIYCMRHEVFSIGKNIFSNGKTILLMCFPAFLSSLLLTLINSMPRYAAFYFCSREESGYVNDIFVLLNFVELAGSFIYYPFIPRITELVRTNSLQARKLILRILVCILGMAVLATVIALCVGRNILSAVYGVDFSSYLFEIAFTVGVCGVFVALISLLYWIPIILRNQGIILRIFSFGFVMSTIGSIIGAMVYGIKGIIIGYSLGTCIITILLLIYFINNTHEGM